MTGTRLWRLSSYGYWRTDETCCTMFKYGGTGISMGVRRNSNTDQRQRSSASPTFTARCRNQNVARDGACHAWQDGDKPRLACAGVLAAALFNLKSGSIHVR